VLRRVERHAAVVRVPHEELVVAALSAAAVAAVVEDVHGVVGSDHHEASLTTGRHQQTAAGPEGGAAVGGPREEDVLHTRGETRPAEVDVVLAAAGEVVDREPRLVLEVGRKADIAGGAVDGRAEGVAPVGGLEDLDVLAGREPERG
jgi:hypothetical protein